MSAGVTEHQLLCLANKIHVTPGLHPSSGRTEQRARPGGQVTLLLNTPNPQVYCLSSQWCLSFVWKHNSSGQSLPGACAPSQRHTVYNPLYSLACSHSRVPSFHELAASRNEHGLPRECRHSGAKNNRGHSLAALSPTQTTVRREKPWKQISVAGLFL